MIGNATNQRAASRNSVRTFRAVTVCCWFVLFLCFVVAQSSPRAMWGMVWDKEADKQVLIVNDITSKSLLTLSRSKRTTAQWQQILAIYAGEATIPMLGTYRIQRGSLVFAPQFPLEPGMRYRAVFSPSRLPGFAKSGIAPLELIHELPAPVSTPTTVVRHVYPSADELPENLLKFYLQFSAPMQRGNIYEHIELRDSAGQKVELPFLEIDEELWDTTLTRLTLFIDPGRIKRGVLPLEEIGPALETGKHYTLLIRRAWKDGAGNPLQADFQKTFRVVAPDRTPPDPAQWKLALPAAGTRTPLRIEFPEPMDHALSQRLLAIMTETGQRIGGVVKLENEERCWVLTPNTNWKAGSYYLVIQTTLEDLAGNNIGKPFEVDVFTGVERHLSTEAVRLPFAIR